MSKKSAFTILDEGVSPEEAISFWKDKLLFTDSEAKSLTERAKARAFYVSGLAELDQVNAVHKALQEALENGETLRDFKKNIASIIEEKGWTGKKSYRVENIFQTNMQSAYSAGRYAQMQKVKDSRPYWQMLCIVDKRTRASHAVLHELVYPCDHEFWESHYPPNGFRCRCTVRSLSEWRLEAEGLSVETKMPQAMKYIEPDGGMERIIHSPKPDKGFSRNVGKDWLSNLHEPMISKLEESHTPFAQAFVRKLVAKDFERWQKEPDFAFPLGVLSKEQSKKLGAKSVVGLFSADTLAKQKKNHAELTLADYKKVQDAIVFGTMYKEEKENALDFILEEPEGVVCVVKATGSKETLFITSVRRLSRDEVERDKEINRLKNKAKK